MGAYPMIYYVTYAAIVSTTPPPGTLLRITENSIIRITEDGQRRITE